MSIKKIAQLCALMLTMSLSALAQDALRDKFLKEPEHSASRPIMTPHRFFTPFHASFYVSTGICVGGGIADIATTDRELNPLLRNSRGGLNVGRAILLKTVSCGWPALIERHHPKFAFWIRTVTGITWGFVAARN